jgi:hypothetical protein
MANRHLLFPESGTGNSFAPIFGELGPDRAQHEVRKVTVKGLPIATLFAFPGASFQGRARFGLAPLERHGWPMRAFFSWQEHDSRCL